MAVIESLQRQIEENLDNVKDVSDDEADGSEENPTEAGENDCENAAPINSEGPSIKPTEKKVDHRENPVNNEVVTNVSEKAGVANLEGPKGNYKLQRVNKKRKVSFEGSSVNKDERENGNGIGEGDSVNPQVPAAKRAKMNVADSVVQPLEEPAAGVKSRSSVQEATANGNDSPSSPLIVRSSDDDFE